MSVTVQQMEDVSAALRRISLVGLTFPVTLQARLSFACEAIYVDMIAEVPERDTGIPIKISRTTPGPMSLGEGWEARLFDEVLSLIEEFAVHEVREAFRVDGARHRDPHARDGA